MGYVRQLFFHIYDGKIVKNDKITIIIFGIKKKLFDSFRSIFFLCRIYQIKLLFCCVISHSR